MQEEQDEHIILRSEEVNEILTSTPKWILRWGISVVFVLIFTAVTLSYFIKYPDILTADITLTTLNPPVNLISRSNGKLTYLLVKNNELVHSGQTIAVIENTSNYNDVLSLHKICTELLNKLKLADTLPEIYFRNDLNVGELTPQYLTVLKSVKDFILFKEVNSFNRQTLLLQKDLLSYKSLLEKYNKQEEISNEQLKLSENDYNRDKSLFESKTISAREYETKKKEYLAVMNANENVKIATSNALIQKNSTEKNILQLQIQNYNEQIKLKTELQQNLNSLKSEIDKWKKLFLIESPVEGRISFFNVWVVNQNVKIDEELFAVIPIQKQQFIGKCILPVLNTGKLEIGQKVNIKLDNYPYNENGILPGYVFNISEIPNKDTYAVDVKLLNGLVTSYNRTLVYREQMKGKADIITKNNSIMDRIFFNLKKLAAKN